MGEYSVRDSYGMYMTSVLLRKVFNQLPLPAKEQTVRDATMFVSQVADL